MDDDLELGFLLSDVARLLRRDFDRRAQRLGLTRAQWSVLARLSRKQGVKQTELAETLEVQPITLARQLDRLEAGGWVRRCADPDDRRARRLYLTDQTGPTLEELHRLGRETFAVALAGLDWQTRDTLREALARVKDNLTA